MSTRFGSGDGRCHVAAIQAAKNGLNYWISISRSAPRVAICVLIWCTVIGTRMAQQSPTKLLTRSRQSAHLRSKTYATKLLQNLGCCGKQLQVSELTRVPLVQLTVCGTEWGYGTLEELIKSSLPGVSLLPFYTHFSNCNCCVVDHVKSLRSGDKYVGLIESKYLAELLQIPISYYTPNNSGRYLACCVESWVDQFITGGSQCYVRHLK